MTHALKKPDAYKIAIVGEGGVGKSSIVQRILRERFTDDISSTIGAAFATYKHGGNTYQLWDTAGQERYQALIPMYLRNARIVLLVYDVNDSDSVKRLENHWVDFVLHNAEGCFMIMIGNKSDIKDIYIKKQIEYVDVLSKQYGCLHIVVSAKTGENTGKIFEEIDKFIEKDKERIALEIPGTIGTVQLRGFDEQINNSRCLPGTCVIL